MKSIQMNVRSFRMRNPLMNCMVVLLAVLVFPFAGFAQGGRQAAPSAPRTFDPRDLNGIWNWATPDRGFNPDVPPMTPEGEKRFSQNKPGYGTPMGAAPRPGAPLEHIGRRRAVPP